MGVSIKLKTIPILVLAFGSALLTACNENKGSGSSAAAAASSSTTSTTTSTSSYSGVNAFQIITKAGATGSFNNVAVPIAGGIEVPAVRLFNLDGSTISTANVPSWFVESKLFLTSTRTSGGAPTYTNADVPCAYFDTVSTDYNPDSDGFYTIDGFNSTPGADIDQCAGTVAAETAKLGAYIKVDRRFMNSTDKFQIIVKAKPIDAPNVAPTASTCVVGGYFDPAACVNQYYTVSMRTAPYASAQPFYVLFPSAKAYDLLSESILLPVQIDSSITTISVDRVKGGALIYGITMLRLL